MSDAMVPTLSHIPSINRHRVWLEQTGPVPRPPLRARASQRDSEIISAIQAIADGPVVRVASAPEPIAPKRMGLCRLWGLCG